MKRYEIQEKITTGSRSVIHKAFDKVNKCTVALKMTLMSGMSKMIQNEVFIMNKVKSNNFIVPLLDYIETKEHGILVFPYYKYGDLFQILAVQGMFK
jgi:serine/threonine protein kinase